MQNLEFSKRLIELGKKYYLRDENVELSDVEKSKEKYVKKLYTLYLTINDGLVEINHIETFMKIDPIPSYYVENGIDEKDYYKHHVENFHVQCISIIDYICHLINHAKQIGLPDRRCSIHSILDNENLKNSDLCRTLKSLDKSFLEIRQNRNKIIHKGKFKLDALTEIDSTLISTGIIEYEQSFLDYIKEERDQKIEAAVETFQKQVKILEDAVGKIYYELVKDINRQLKIFEIEI